MKRLLLLIALLFSAGVSDAAFRLLFGDTFARGTPWYGTCGTITAGGLGNGYSRWFDQGSKWSVNSNCFANAAAGAANASELSFNLLANTTAQDQEGDIIIAPNSSQAGHTIQLRKPIGDVNLRYELSFFAGPTGNCIISSNTATTSGNILVQTNCVSSYNTSHYYLMRTRAIGINPTTLQLIIDDLTAGSNAFTSAAFSDSTPALQISTASFGLTSNNATQPANITAVGFYDASGTANVSVTPSSAPWIAGVPSTQDGWVWDASSTSAMAVWPNNRLMLKVGNTRSVHIKFDVSAYATAGTAIADYAWVTYRVDASSATSFSLVPAMQFSSAPLTTLVHDLDPGTTHDIEIIYDRSSGNADRWTTPVQVVKISSIQLDPGGYLLTPYTRPNGKAMIYGDSICENSLMLASSGITAQDSITGFVYNAMEGLGMDYATQCMSTWDMNTVTAGVNNVPDGYVVGVSSAQAMKFNDAASTHTYAGMTDMLVFLGTNDASHGASSAQHAASTEAFILWARNTQNYTGRITLFTPPGRFQKSSYQQVVTDLADPKVRFVDTGLEPALGLTNNLNGDGTAGSGGNGYNAALDTSGIHPDFHGHAKYAAAIVNGYKAAWGTSSTGAIFTYP